MSLNSPITATAAYRATAGQALPGTGQTMPGAEPQGAGGGFAQALTKAVEQTVDTMHQADAATEAGIMGNASATEVVLAVARAELALQTTVAIRDRVVQAYQDVMRMPI
jgi:flagellar hook-basal body complex protein FliE